MKYLLAVLFVCFASTFAIEQNQQGTSFVFSGTKLLRYCQADLDAVPKDFHVTDVNEAWSIGNCQGLVEGISFASPDVCVRPSVTLEQGVRAVVKYLNDNPRIVDQDGRMLAVFALRQAFPCTKRPRTT